MVAGLLIVLALAGALAMAEYVVPQAKGLTQRILHPDPKGRLIAFAAGAVLVVAVDAAFGPWSYEDCILAAAENASTDLAMRAAAGACNRKFNP